jgi:cell division protein FtsA
MEKENIAVGLDIGTTKIVAMIGKKNEYGKLEILGVGKSKSLGVARGVVNNITQTIHSIQQAILEAETNSGYKIKDVVVGIAGQHIRSIQHSDYISRSNAEEVIGGKDIDLLINQVHKLAMLPGEEIIHVLPQEFKIDGQSDIKEPIGMYGGRLESSFHVVVGQASSIRNVGRCIQSSGIELSGLTLEPLASADAVLSQEEKEAGVALIDIGGGTTDLAIFKDGIIRHTAVIPFGGNVITEDIKEGCSIIEKQAELLKIKFGSAWPGENKDNEIVSIPGLRGREPKEISLKNLSKIIHARVVEIIEQVFAEIKAYGHEDPRKKLIAGIVLTGTEIKSIRLGKASIAESFCEFNDHTELFLINATIEEYAFGTHYNHKAKSERKLLLNKKELKKLDKDSDNKGLTIVPLKLYTNEKGIKKERAFPSRELTKVGGKSRRRTRKRIR